MAKGQIEFEKFEGKELDELMKVVNALISSKEQSRYLRFFWFCWRELLPMKHGIKGSLCSNRAEFRLVMVRHRIGVEKKKELLSRRS